MRQLFAYTLFWLLSLIRPKESAVLTIQRLLKVHRCCLLGHEMFVLESKQVADLRTETGCTEDDIAKVGAPLSTTGQVTSSICTVCWQLDDQISLAKSTLNHIVERRRQQQ